jgi:hypothetical protein
MAGFSLNATLIITFRIQYLNRGYPAVSSAIGKFSSPDGATLSYAWAFLPVKKIISKALSEKRL